MKQRFKFARRIFGLTLVLLIFIASVFLEGCEPLRKKFTRKKKKERTEEIEVPILEPIEYPAKVFSPQDEYKRYFSLWRVWCKELLQGLEESSSQKRRVYLVNQVLKNLTGMQNLLPPEKQEGLEKGIGRLQKMLTDIQAPVSTRNISSWRNEVASVEKVINREYTFKDMEGFIR